MSKVNEFLNEFLKPDENYTIHYEHYLKDEFVDENTRRPGLKIGIRVEGEGTFKRKILKEIAKRHNVFLEEWDIKKGRSDPPLYCCFFCFDLSEEMPKLKSESEREEKTKEVMKNLIECMRERSELNCKE